MHVAWIYFDSTGWYERFGETKCTDKIRGFLVGAVEFDEGVDFIADQVEAPFLTKLHEVKQGLAGITPRKGVVGIA